MKSFFEGIQWLFDNIILGLHEVLRSLELSNWWLANIISWAFIIICCYYTWYWTKQLQSHKDNNEENQDTTAHSFLK
ncbi:uracil phosphoribosyltransferase [Flavobacterium sp.]|uniref:DUF6341 family protein n=1 Tax=Flavobacterium sp. TaxID=239 RepID=UPI003751D540